MISLQKSEFGHVAFLRASYLENLVVAVIFMEKRTVFIIGLPVFSCEVQPDSKNNIICVHSSLFFLCIYFLQYNDQKTGVNI